jgi:hypothetical protein
MDARRQAGFTSNKMEDDKSFMRYLVEDVHIPEIEEEYQRLFGNNN